MVKLYIENKLIELDSEVQFAITKTFEDITNPTSIINDWSKTVSIPFTDNNNEVFGHIYNPDRLTLHTSNESLTTGLYFNPLKKLNFRLEWDSMLLMQGYAKMTSVTKSDGKGRYNVTLNGELGKIFQEMKKITFSPFKYKLYEDDFKYFLDSSDYYNEVLNANLVKDTEIVYEYVDKLQRRSNRDYKRNNLINFTLNNNFVENFDYKSFCGEDDKIKTFEEYFNEATYTSENKTFEEIFGISPESLINDGFNPITTNEFRATTQIPYIFYNQLFRMYFEKVEQVTGYKVNYDITWFNDFNPYWTKYIMTLNGIFANSTFVDQAFPKVRRSNTEYNKAFTMVNEYQFTELADDFSDLPTLPITFQVIFKTETPITNKNALTTADDAQILGEIYNELKEDSKYAVPIYGDVQQFWMKNNPIEEWHEVEWKYKITSPDTITVTFTMQGNWQFLKDIVDNKPSATWLRTCIIKAGIEGNPFLYNGVPLNYKYVDFIADISKTNTNKSILSNENRVNIFSFWDDTVSIFDVILYYLKIFRINLILNDVTKTINLTSSKKYFEDYKILDYTNKLDTSKEFTITPITFDKKYILFNTGEVDTRLHKAYKDKIGYNYGDKRLKTDYNFNDETKKLFETELKYAISFNPSNYSIIGLKPGYDIYNPIRGGVSELSLNEFGDDNNKVSTSFGFIGFYLYTYTNQSLFITDNTESMQKNECCCYKNPYELYSSTSEIPIGGYSYVSEIVMKDVKTWFWSTFGTPELSFSNISNFTDSNTFDVFTSVWQNYLDERYNTNNKLVSCYLDIKPFDYCNFEFNNFIKIDNQLYFVNKIYDYDITSNSPTKVDLITVQDLNGYTQTTTTTPLDVFVIYKNNNQEWNDSKDYIRLNDKGQTQTIYITSTKPVTWTDESLTLQNMVIYYNNDTTTSKKGEGTIPSGARVPVTFKMDDNIDESGTVVFRSGDKEHKVKVELVRNENFTVYDTDKTEYNTSDKVILQNTSPLTKTIYITSPNVDVSWNDNGTNLQDLCVNGVAGSGTIPKGTLVPVTLTMDVGDNYPKDMPVYGKIKFFTSEKTVIIDIMLIWREIFTVYKWDGEVWDVNFDYIELTPSEPIKTLYLTANDDVEWSDVNSNLQSLGINAGGNPEDWGEYEMANGVINAPSNSKPIYFRLNTQTQQGRDEGKVSFFNGRHEWFIDVVLKDNYS